MSDVIDGLSGEDKASGFERVRQEGDHERQSEILANAEERHTAAADCKKCGCFP